MLEDKDKDDIFKNLLQHLMNEMGSGDVHDRFDPESMKEDMPDHMMSSDESGEDDMEGAPIGIAIKKEVQPVSMEDVKHMAMPGMESDDEDDMEPSPFSRDFFKKKR